MTKEKGKKVFPVTNNVLMDGETKKLYDLDGNYLGHLNLKTEQFIYNDDCPNDLKAELGIFLMKLRDIDVNEV
jgi:hypothetical protein